MISIYLCSCNGVRFIKEQLKSIFEQTISPDEVIISDDFSSDGTYEVVQSFIEQNKLKDSWCLIRNEPTLGYPRNFYEGINRCKHEFIFFADQDDIWEPTKLEIMAGQMENLSLIHI